MGRDGRKCIGDVLFDMLGVLGVEGGFGDDGGMEALVTRIQGFCHLDYGIFQIKECLEHH